MLDGCFSSSFSLQLAAYSEADQLLFSSNLFSAHVAPEVAGARGLDDGGWRALGEDWRHYYDCMLAPVARQAAGGPAGGNGAWCAGPGWSQPASVTYAWLPSDGQVLSPSAPPCSLP